MAFPAGFATLGGVPRVEVQLEAALAELEAAVRDPRKPPLVPLFEQIDRLAAQLPPDADPELRHFLQRKSYARARERLRGGAVARGSCGH